ncbi:MULTISPECIES: N-formylglutamate deformylase [unclassified Herbaspirillum]|uniref:N-formylglutamate deformylase n=1 Tax=unclassified Herbaspirillum TaxID=2624150 RepID=UPI00114DF052|nr:MULTISPECIES: N-formylglutamate deformylase [unclassified Herbaspirillum]MBB5393308.1 N-formylglutamate deformylase [Herbaspirillum sp. SJZ102]TQK03943.1 N-formylglutamate deformylase [Herbaspirillum sp. SJZ130]TQK08675.1 N-formylglutamate deformylase [Herbaspirillum sp. SJZ106]TWC71946.1 N-formylglutamate deformylase [Herbaspirillum sp. SJZ099]
MTQEVFKLRQGTSPLLISMPHVGTLLPEELQPAFSDVGLQVDDTDWHIEDLYDFAGELGVSVIRPLYSRYVIDLNRPADGKSLYPGQNTTGLCPLTTFDNVPLYKPGMAPDDDEVARRLPLYWQPYHDALQAELERLKSIHGYALLWDAHSIRSVIPHLFEGELPVFNFGSASGQSCAPGVAEALLKQAQALAPHYPAVLNGRFKGGYITRNYGRPADKVHAVQLELAQRSYMEEQAPYALDAVLSGKLKPVLREFITSYLAFKPS